MASKINADWKDELSPRVKCCVKHSSFTLEFFCNQCRKNVCAVCAAVEHSRHDIGYVKTQKEKISELRGDLEIRKRDVKNMKSACNEMLQHVHEIIEDKLFSIEQERERRRSSLELERNDFERRVKGITECLEKEENKIYALEFSSEAALSTKQEGGEENCLDDIQEELGKCTSAQLPRVKTYNNLKVKFSTMLSANRFSSLSSTPKEEWEGTFFQAPTFCFDDSMSEGPQPGQLCRSLEVGVAGSSGSHGIRHQTCTSPSEITGMTLTQEECKREEGQSIMRNSEDESEIEDPLGDMDTDDDSDCEGIGAVGGLAFKSERERTGERQIKKGTPTHSGRYDVVLSDLARHLLPDNLTPLGLRLGLSNTIIKQIRYDNRHSIGDAIFEILQEWKRSLSVDILTEDHFKKLEGCLRKIENEDAADWLIERLQDYTGHFVRPSSAHDQSVQPSTSHSVQPSSSDSQ